MNDLFDMIWIEQRKALRSSVPLFTTLGSLFVPLGIAFLIFISRNPEISRKLGLISAKANLMSNTATNWPSYLGLFAEMIAAAGFFLFVMIISWVFGREFTDGTLKDMLAVPIRRSSILLAKFIVTAVWCAAVTIVIFVAGLVMGAIIKLPEGSIGVILAGGALTTITACLVMAVIMPFAFLASVGRGYLLPMGAAVLALIMANVVMVAGWGEYFPWAIPGLFSQGKNLLAPSGYWIVILTGLAGIFGTYLWWKFADQNR
jgi:ABC-2 type transport system permease protein